MQPLSQLLHNPMHTPSSTGPPVVGKREAIYTGKFRLVATADRINPPMASGDFLILDADREAQPGQTVLLNAQNDTGTLFSAIMRINADRDAVDDDGGYLAAGEFVVVAVVIDVQPGSIYQHEVIEDDDPRE